MDESVEVLMPDQAVHTSDHEHAAGTDTEQSLAAILADLTGNEQVPLDSHFFDDLGANSLVMAHFCARVRKRPDVPSASMKDIYKYPTLRLLAAALADAPPAERPSHQQLSPTQSATTRPSTAVMSFGGSSANAAPVVQTPAQAAASSPAEASTSRYVVCGALQLLIFLAYSYLAALATYSGYTWVTDGSGLVDSYLRAVLAGGIGFLGLCAFPVAAKWILVGRWRAGEFPIWGFEYLRFWTIKSLLHANPIILFVGNPIYVLYLRALGARIGKGVTILSPSVPVCTDLLTVGAGSVIRKDSLFLGYRAHQGRIQTGSITLGRDTFVGEKTVLDINTSMGDGAQLGHTSALQSGQAVPAGQRWHGSPVERTEVDYVRVAPAKCSSWRRAGFGLAALLQVIFVYMPLSIGGAYALVSAVPGLGDLLAAKALTSPELYRDALILSLALFLGFLVLALAVMFTVPRLLNIVIKPDRVYPLYGFHYSVHRAITRLTNIKFFKWLLGDSSYIVPYLRCLGYDLSHVEQTGSNFGTEVQHETPYLSSVGSGTMVADGLSIVNADYSSTSFRVSAVSIGPHNFLGNNIAYPSQGKTGDNCLLATKVMIPLDGPVREGVGLLGSPCFEIPRSVERDTRFDHLRTGEALQVHLAQKNRYNLRSMGIFLVVRWVHVFVLTLFGLAAIDLNGAYGHFFIAATFAASLGFTALYFIFVERCIGAFRALRPQLCSIYEPYFWWHERLWKVPDTYLNAFNGTPFKNVIWRLLGVRLGRRVFDDGCYMTERTLTSVGDDCTLNAGSKIQCHSQEDGTFKSDGSTLGAGSTLGVGAFVHYGVTVGDGAVLAADSFLMKGEDVPAQALWGGNPATETREASRQRDEDALRNKVLSGSE